MQPDKTIDTTQSQTGPTLYVGLALGLSLATLAPKAGADPMEVTSDVSATPCSQRLQPVFAPDLDDVEGEIDDIIEQRFGSHRDWGLENLSLVEDPQAGAVLRAFFPAGTSSPSDGKRGGAGFYAAPQALAGAEHACLRYRLHFPDGFDFVKGGKLPGLYGGEAPSGGTQATGDNGFSARFMWRRDGQGELYAYVVNQDTAYGASLGRGSWHFASGDWVTVEQEIRLNDPDRQDGLMRVWIDGEPRLEVSGVEFRDVQDAHIDGLMFSTFFGGTGESWRTPRDQYLDFADFKFYRR